MATTPLEVPFEVAREGGFPSDEEFDRVEAAIADAQEFGVDRLFSRLTLPLIEAFEASEPLKITVEDVGLFYIKAGNILQETKWLHEKAQKLWDVGQDLARTAETGTGDVSGPTFGRFGGDYQHDLEAHEQIKALDEAMDVKGHREKLIAAAAEQLAGA